MFLIIYVKDPSNKNEKFQRIKNKKFNYNLEIRGFRPNKIFLKQ